MLAFNTRRRDLQQFEPLAGTDIRDAIDDVISMCKDSGEPIELIHNENHIVVLPVSSPLDIYGEWVRQLEAAQRNIKIGREQYANER